MRARMSNKGPLTISGRVGPRSSTGLPTVDGSAFASVPGGARGPVAAAIASSAKTPGLGEEVVANLTPLELVQTKAASAARASGSRASKGNGPIDIIVVEDLGVAQKIAHAALTRGHYKVEVAGSGEEALELFRKHLGMLKAVLMDIQLPGISGTETTEKMRRMEAEAGVAPVWIYGLTGNVSEEDLDKYKSVGMNGCILKGKLLADAVRQAMEESQNGVEFVNLCDKQASGSAPAARAPAPSPSHFQQASNPAVAAAQQGAQAPAPFNGSVSSIRTEPMGVNTPRAPEPRKLMQNRYEGSGQVKPGIGLPHAQPAPVGPNMLLVEDVRVSQKVAVTALTRAGYKVVAADNGESAVEKYRQHASTFRYIIMDINLPGISGIEATEQIRALEKESPAGSGGHPVYIFGLTGNVDAESMRNYEAAGMNGCILKGKVLADAVKQAIEQADQGSFVNIS
jgi:CheY-like chemotaxis protein